MTNFNDLLSFLANLGAAAMGVGSLVWFIGVQFSNMRKLIHEKVDGVQKVLLDKIEYHERHDDQRFASLNNDLWAIKLQNAARYGLRPDIQLDDEVKAKSRKG